MFGRLVFVSYLPTLGGPVDENVSRTRPIIVSREENYFSLLKIGDDWLPQFEKELVDLMYT